MNLESRLIVCKTNKYEMNNFIEQYKPFIANVVQKQVGKYVQYGKDDETSIGLIAFDEAIRSYKSDKGPFLPFAENIIRLRLIDYLRKESKHNNAVPMSDFYNEEEDEHIDITVKESIKEHSINEERQDIKFEIMELQRELSRWGMSFRELTKVSPKHSETKDMFKKIIKIAIDSQSILQTILQKRYFPVAEISLASGIHKKTVERSRKYVIAMLIILSGDYKCIQSYLNWR